MNFVILSAALSSMNTNLYLCTRMIFSLSRSGHAPAALGKVNARGTPLRAAVLSACGVLIAAMTAYASRKAYNYLFGIALFGAILTWLIILATHLQFRRKYSAGEARAADLARAIFALSAVARLAAPGRHLITMGLDTDSGTSRSSWVCLGSPS